MISVNFLKELSHHSLDPQAITLTYLLSEVNQFIVLTDHTLVYPKNLYQKNEIIELYLFDDHGHIFRVYQMDEAFYIETYYKSDIHKMVYISDVESISLTISFQCGMQIFLTPTKDTTLSYRRDLNHQLKQIYRQLLDIKIYE